MSAIISSFQKNNIVKGLQSGAFFHALKGEVKGENGRKVARSGVKRRKME